MQRKITLTLMKKNTAFISKKNFTKTTPTKFAMIFLLIKQDSLSAKEYIKCSAVLHNSENLKRMQISDCRKITKVIESFYNPDLGKFFTYFADISYDRKDIIFRNNDLIQFFINDTIFFNGLDSSIYSYLSIFLHNPKILIMETVIYLQSN